MIPSDSRVSLSGVDVSRETEARLGQLVELVRKWTAHINLVSAKSLSEIWDRHVLDSLQLFKFLPGGTRHWADLGSGGGFPGLAICIVAKEHMPMMKVTLVESDLRKATFLRTVVRELDLSAVVKAVRIEAAEPLMADVLSARALGPLNQLLTFSERHLAEAGICLFPKGRQVKQEIDAARLNWHFELTSYPSTTDPEAQILRVENIRHV